MIQILDLENDKVVPNINCHSIPELKAVIGEYKDPIPALSYLYYKITPSSAYAHLSEDEKEDVLIQDFPGEYTLEDEVMIKAEEKLLLLTLTPTRKFYLNAKVGLEKMGDYLATESITAGLHGNANFFGQQMGKVGNTMEQFKKLEKIYEEETKSNVRGGRTLGYDEV